MGKLLHQLQLLRESSPGWAQPPQTHSPTDFCQNRISYLSHICHDKTRNSSVSLRLEKGKEDFAEKPGQTSKLPNTQSPPGQLCLVSYLKYVWFLSRGIVFTWFLFFMLTLFFPSPNYLTTWTTCILYTLYTIQDASGMVFHFASFCYPIPAGSCSWCSIVSG